MPILHLLAEVILPFIPIVIALWACLRMLRREGPKNTETFDDRWQD